MRPRLFSVISNSWAEICWFSAAISLSLAFKRSFLTVNVVTFSFCRDKIRCSITKFHLFHPLTLYSPFLSTPTSALPLPISHFPMILCPSSLLPSNRRRKGGGHQGHMPPLGNLHTTCDPPSNSYTTVRTNQKRDSHAHQPCTWNFIIAWNMSYNMFQRVNHVCENDATALRSIMCSLATHLTCT